jgi:peptidoglycan/LPS O-acetylase OafA/YrhL
MAQAPTATAPRTARLDYVDGLRGIAVLLVLVFHVAERWPALAHDRLGYLAGFGSRGVEVFFVLSGLCLAYPALRARANGDRRPFDLRRYAARRFARIVPPYYAAIAIFAALSFTPLWRAAAAFAPHCMRAAIPLRGTIDELLFVDRAYPMHNLSFWSLAIEFRWYFLFPFALGLMLAQARAFYGVLAGVAAIELSGRIVSNDLGALPSFLLGIVAADAIVYERTWTRFAPYGALAAFACAALSGVRPGDHASLAWSAACFFFVVAATRRGPWQALLRTRPIVATGIASYSIYLIHEPILTYVEQVLRWPPLLSGAVALVAGGAFWAVVERPATRLWSGCQARSASASTVGIENGSSSVAASVALSGSGISSSSGRCKATVTSPERVVVSPRISHPCEPMSASDGSTPRSNSRAAIV